MNINVTHNNMCAYTNTLLIICCAIDMGEDSDRGSLSQAKLGYTDHRCNLHHFLDSDAGDKCTTVENAMLQKATNTHPFPADCCKLRTFDACVEVTTK